jgi:TonB family protein
MKILDVVACVLLALAAGGAFAQETPGVVAAQVAPAVCPGQKMQSPRYPHQVLKNRKSGEVRLSLAVDECGRVLDARVVEHSGSKAFDKAALETVQGWILGPTTPEARANMIDGRIELALGFEQEPVALPTSRSMGWPSTHKRPRYVLEPAGEFPSVEAAREVARATRERTYNPPYEGMLGSFVGTGTPDQPEFWLLPYIDGRIDMAVRYRPVMVNAEPVVRVLVVCAKPAAMCAVDESFLLKGLPFAKASNP